jgi:excisionase family DNA binding protein
VASGHRNTRTDPDPLVVSPRTAAALIDCSKANVYNLMRAGRLRRLEIAGTRSVRIPLEDIHRLIGIGTTDEVSS